MKPHELTTNYEKVRALMVSDEKYRDNDNALWSRIVANYLGGMEVIKVMSAYELLWKMTEGKLPSFESVSRIRRKVQEDHPELRGNFYDVKQDKQTEIKQELGYK